MEIVFEFVDTQTEEKPVAEETVQEEQPEEPVQPEAEDVPVAEPEPVQEEQPVAVEAEPEPAQPEAEDVPVADPEPAQEEQQPVDVAVAEPEPEPEPVQEEQPVAVEAEPEPAQPEAEDVPVAEPEPVQEEQPVVTVVATKSLEEIQKGIISSAMAVGRKRQREREESDHHTIDAACERLRENAGTRKVRLLKMVGLRTCALLDFKKKCEDVFGAPRTLREWTVVGRGMQQTLVDQPPYFVQRGDWMDWHPDWRSHFKGCSSCSSMFF